MNLMWWRKPRPSVDELISKAVSDALERERQKQETMDVIKAATDVLSHETNQEGEVPAIEEPLVRITITCQVNSTGNLEALYNVEHNEAGIQSIDRSYSEMPRWNKMRPDQEKIIMFLYDAVSTLAEPLLPDATVTELDLRREIFETNPQPWITNEVDIAHAERYGKT